MLGVLLDMKTLEDGWYVVKKAYKLASFEFLRDMLVLAYIVSVYVAIVSTDSMIHNSQLTVL